MNKRPSKIYDLHEAREKIRAYCLYRERSQAEVREKLVSYGLIPSVVDELLTELIEERYINEERFAKAFVRGKFNIKKWGRNKIRSALYRHDLSDYILNKALDEIDEEEYHKTMEELLLRKQKSVRAKNSFRKNGVLAQWLISRGFEPEIVWDKIKGEN